MELETLINAVGSVGFPIVCCFIMFRQNEELQKTLNEISKTMTLLSERIKDIETKIDKKEDKKEDK